MAGIAAEVGQAIVFCGLPLVGLSVWPAQAFVPVFFRDNESMKIDLDLELPAGTIDKELERELVNLAREDIVLRLIDESVRVGRQ